MYKKVWKQLLCFLYRLVWQQQQPSLHCCLTAAQTVALSSVVERAAEVIQQREDGDIGQESAAAQMAALDQATLLLCIALLDHALYKDIYDSVIVGFLAVLGIKKDGCFSEATNYTSYLSAFIKMAQLLVI
jgi:hypothetical protein